jgi:hypothetical protein
MVRAQPDGSVSIDALVRSLPPKCAIEFMEEIPGDPSAGLDQVWQELLQNIQSLDSTCNTLILDATTGSGKSKVFPSLAASEGKTLLATTVKVDVKDIANKASVPTYWQVGGKVSDGDKRSSALHVVTVGLLQKWVVENPKTIEQYDFIIFDEYDAAVNNAAHATLIDIVRKSCKRCILMSATHCPAAEAMLKKGEAKRFQYNKRKHPLYKFDMICPPGEEESCLVTLAKNLHGGCLRNCMLASNGPLQFVKSMFPLTLQIDFTLTSKLTSKLTSN